MTEDVDVIICGCGISGATAARILAEEHNKKILIIEKRNHIGGNLFDEYDTNGILIHKYGPHIFHTKHQHVFHHLSRFTDWMEYKHKVLGYIDGYFVPIPFNFASIDMLFQNEEAENIKNSLNEAFPEKPRVSIFELLNADTYDVRNFGKFVYEKVFVNYTAKQWGTPINEVDAIVLNRVPVVLGYQDGYFSDPIQVMPKDGYASMMTQMLKHENITVYTNTDFKEYIKLDFNSNSLIFNDQPFEGHIIYTGAIDELLAYRYGQLPYRSLDIIFEQHSITQYQPKAVVNYPNDYEFTRITEFKQLTGQQLDGTTTICKEYPRSHDVNTDTAPYYPIISKDNDALYQKYVQELSKFPRFHLLGRLAEYRYYDMDQATLAAMGLSKRLSLQNEGCEPIA